MGFSLISLANLFYYGSNEIVRSSCKILLNILRISKIKNSTINNKEENVVSFKNMITGGASCITHFVKLHYSII